MAHRFSKPGITNSYANIMDSYLINLFDGRIQRCKVFLLHISKTFYLPEYNRANLLFGYHARIDWINTLREKLS